MRHWPASELLVPTDDRRYRRMVVQKPRVRAGTLSFPPGEHVAEHAHIESDEVFYVISGRARFVIEEAVVDVGPGDLLFAARAERHSILVGHPEPLVILAVVTPNLLDAVASTDPFPIPPIT